MKIQAIIAIIALTLVVSIVYAQAQISPAGSKAANSQAPGFPANSTSNMSNSQAENNSQADGSTQSNQPGTAVNGPNHATPGSTMMNGSTSGVTGATSGMGSGTGNGLSQGMSVGIAPQSTDPAGSVSGYGSKTGQEALPSNATGSNGPASNGSNAYMR